jgi:quercetin dioxygenase-like cupin family protein
VTAAVTSDHNFARAGYDRAMEHWDLRSLDVEPHQPRILHSARGEARSIAIHLPKGEALQQHQVHERAYLVVIDGEVQVRNEGDSITGGAGFAVVFDPQERHEVRATDDARLLLVLAPWPGDGHPGARD